MSATARFHLLALCCAAAAMINCGCEDANAKRRAEVQAVITDSSQALWKVPAVQGETPQDVRSQAHQELTAIIAQLADTRGGASGQQAAASLLAASAHRKLAAIALGQAQQLEADHRAKRTTLRSTIAMSARLETLAASLEAVQADAEQAQLTLAHDAAEDQLLQHAQQVASLDGPIADLTTKNRNDQDQVGRLREQANRLRREAADRGPYDGFETYEQGVQLDRQADRIEFEIGQRESELRYGLLPQHAVAQTRAEHTQTQIGTIEDARRSLDALVQAAAEEARITRAQLAEVRQVTAAILKELNQSTAVQLQNLYEEAATQLQSASSKAREAVTLTAGEAADAARIEAARADQELGGMHWAVAQATQDHISVLQTLSAAPGASGTGSDEIESVTAGLSDALAAAEASIDQAKDAYTSALDVLNKVSGRTARRELDSLKNQIDLTLSALSGDTNEQPTEPAPAP